MNDKLVRAGAVDDASTASVDLAVAATVAMATAVTTAAAAARRGGDGFSSHLIRALGGGLRGCLGLCGVAVAAASAASVLSSGGLLGGSDLLGALLLAFVAAAAPAATALGGDGVGVDQLEHLTISHIFSLSFGPQGHFSEPYPV